MGGSLRCSSQTKHLRCPGRLPSPRDCVTSMQCSEAYMIRFRRREDEVKDVVTFSSGERNPGFGTCKLRGEPHPQTRHLELCNPRSFAEST